MRGANGKSYIRQNCAAVQGLNDKTYQKYKTMKDKLDLSD